MEGLHWIDGIVVVSYALGMLALVSNTARICFNVKSLKLDQPPARMGVALLQAVWETSVHRRFLHTSSKNVSNSREVRS